jgi:hypothetical protein
VLSAVLPDAVVSWLLLVFSGLGAVVNALAITLVSSHISHALRNRSTWTLRSPRFVRSPGAALICTVMGRSGALAGGAPSAGGFEP